MSRAALLQVLRGRCAELGVQLRFKPDLEPGESDLHSVARLEETSDHRGAGAPWPDPFAAAAGRLASARHGGTR